MCIAFQDFSALFSADLSCQPDGFFNTDGDFFHVKGLNAVQGRVEILEFGMGVEPEHRDSDTVETAVISGVLERTFLVNRVDLRELFGKTDVNNICSKMHSHTVKVHEKFPLALRMGFDKGVTAHRIGADTILFGIK